MKCECCVLEISLLDVGLCYSKALTHVWSPLMLWEPIHFLSRAQFNYKPK